MAKIRVKVGNAEAEVEAEPDKLQEAIDLVPALIAKLPNTLAGVSAKSPPVMAEPAESASAQSQVEVPVVTLEKGDSLSEVIEKFFADPWGRDRRKLSDVRTALQSYGLNYPKQSVAVALLRLAKTTRIRRFKADDGEYVYTSGNIGATQVRPPLEETGEAAGVPMEQSTSP